jgi:hypothetical protein
MARVSPYELGNVVAFVYEAAKGSPGEWSSPQPKCPSLAPQQGSGPDAAEGRSSVGSCVLCVGPEGLGRGNDRRPASPSTSACEA